MGPVYPILGSLSRGGFLGGPTKRATRRWLTPKGFVFNCRYALGADGTTVLVVVVGEHAKRLVRGDSAIKLRQEPTLTGNDAALPSVLERVRVEDAGLLAHIVAEDVDGAVDDAVVVAILHN